MNLAALLVFTAVAGYVLSDRCLRYKYILPRIQGHKYYLRSLFYGLPFISISYLLSEFLFFLPLQYEFKPIVSVTPEQKFFGIGIVAIAISYFGSNIYNWWIGPAGKKEKFKEAMNTNDFDLVLYESMETLEPVLLTMENRKAYVGLLFDTFEPSEENSYVTIVPLLSGYRDKDTLNLTLTIRYDFILDLLGAEEDDDLEINKISGYKMAFPREKVIGLHLYNDHLYKDVQKQIATDA